MESQNFLQDTFRYVEDYHTKTGEIIQKEAKRLKVGAKGDGNYSLQLSVSTTVRQQGNLIIGETSFRTYGRFRDMGTGSGGRESRKPAKFYSPPYFGRLTALQGVVNLQMAELAGEIITNKLSGNL